MSYEIYETSFFVHVLCFQFRMNPITIPSLSSHIISTEESTKPFRCQNSTSVRFCLSYIYYPLKWDFIAFKMNIVSIRKRIVDTDVVSDSTFTRQSVITRKVIRSL